MFTKQQFETTASRLSNLYDKNRRVAAGQISQAEIFIAAAGPIPLVPLHRVILGLKGRDMLMRNRSGQETIRVAHDLRQAGFQEVRSGHKAFYETWTQYAELCSQLGRPHSEGEDGRSRRTFWTCASKAQVFQSKPSAIKITMKEDAEYWEGGATQITTNQYERNPEARQACVDHFLARFGRLYCVACEFDFEKFYGSLGRGFVHVHHTKDLASRGGSSPTDPYTDLVPVCPNCHAMIHRRKPMLSVEELQDMIRQARV